MMGILQLLTLHPSINKETRKRPKILQWE